MRENTHMEHFEDLLFESWGYELLEKFKLNDVKYTRKWDGAPSIFFGKDEDGYWIARKGIFNKIPLKYYKRSDFDDDPKFPEELKTAMWNTLVYLQNAYIGPSDAMVQGDLMFFNQTGNIKEFHPNTIRYETSIIPRSAIVGIVWHTAYHNDKVVYGAKIKEQFKITDELWMINAHDEVSDPKDIDLPLRIVKSVVGRYSDLSDNTKGLYKMWRNAQIKGTGTDNIFAGTDTKTDSHDEMNASITYAVASGVSAVLGYTNVDQNDEGASDDTGGSSWYVGATMSF